jgi:beta-lactamase regulating signal transducer with metallopeptidase domain
MEMISRLVATFLVNALWQVALVAAAAALAARLMRSAPARYQHGVWLAALGLCLALPLASLRMAAGAAPGSSRGAMGAIKDTLPAPNSARSTSAEQLRQAGPHTLTAGSGASHPPASRQPFRIPALAVSAARAGYVALGFFLFLLLRVASFLGMWRRTQAVVRSAHSQPLPAWAADLAERSRRAFGLGPVSILFSPEVRSPLTLGARRPAIVLPEGFIERADPRELASALGHEMAHLARHDYSLNLVAEIIHLPLTFHPAANLVRRRINETRELACDDLAAGRLVPASDYARSLVAIAEALAVATQTSRPNYSLGVFDANNLEDRVMRLLHPRPRRSARAARALLAAGSLQMAAAFMAAASFPLSIAQTTAETDAKFSLKHFVGTWTANYEGQTYIEVSLKQKGDELSGSVSLGNFGIDNDGQVNHVQDEPSPDHANSISSSRLEGDTLTFVAGAHHFQMKVVGEDKAKIKWAPANYDSLAPEPGWWTITRTLAKTENEISSGGPSGGVVGGVAGGVKGPARMLEGTVKGGVSGAVSATSGTAEIPGTVSVKVRVAVPSGAREKATPGDAVNVVRLINTAEADYKMKMGKYASWQDLLDSPTFQETLNRTQNVYHLEKSALASGPEIIPGYQLRLVVSPAGDDYILSLEEAPFEDCSIFFYSDDRGIIQEGKNIGCNSSGR